MAFENSLKNRILKDALLSLFIYALPVLLMLGWFAYKGEKPWLTSAHTTQTVVK